MPLWLVAIIFLAAIVALILRPSKQYRWLRIALYILIVLAILYTIATIALLGGIE